MIAYERISLKTFRDEGEALRAEHWQEVGHSKEVRTLGLNWPAFEQLEREDALYVLGVRLDGVLVGYTVSILRPHLHSVDTLFAHVDLIYLQPKARQGAVGARLIKHTDTALQAVGAQFITWHVKPEKDFAAILRRNGHALIESIYGKRCGGGA